MITAIAAARLGTRVELASALGRDAVHRVRGEDVKVRNFKRPAEPHAVSVALSTRADRAFATFDGVNELLEARLLDWLDDTGPGARHVHVALGPRQLDRWVKVLVRLRAQGTTTSWDFGWHERLARDRRFPALVNAVDWVFVNEREARHYAQAPTLARAVPLWRRLARGTVIKKGAKGSLAVLPSGLLAATAPRVRVVDTTGAGDAFNGGFLAALLRGQPIATCLRVGSLVGSLSTRRPGGIDALPTHDELPAWARDALSAASTDDRVPVSGSRVPSAGHRVSAAK